MKQNYKLILVFVLLFRHAAKLQMEVKLHLGAFLGGYILMRTSARNARNVSADLRMSK